MYGLGPGFVEAAFIHAKLKSERAARNAVQKPARAAGQKRVVTAKTESHRANVQRMLKEAEAELARPRLANGPPQQAKPAAPTREQIAAWIAEGAKNPICNT